MKKQNFIIMMLLALMSFGAYAETAAEFKARIKSLSDSEIMALIEKRIDGEGQWSYSDSSDKIDIVWTGIGACRLSDARSCSSCACDYYFKSNHPNNRHKGTSPYTQVYNGYTKNKANNAGTGCMQVDGHSGGCYHNSTDGNSHLCGGSVSKVTAAHVRHAMDDPADPCAIDDYLKSIKPKSRFSIKATEISKIVVEKKDNGDFGRCGVKVKIPAHLIKPRTMPAYSIFLKKFFKKRYERLQMRVERDNKRLAETFTLDYGVLKLTKSFCHTAIQYKNNNSGQFPGQTHLTRKFEEVLDTKTFIKAVSLGKKWDGEGAGIISANSDDETAETAMVESQFMLNTMTDKLAEAEYADIAAADQAKFVEVAEFVIQEINTLGIETATQFGDVVGHSSVSAFTPDKTAGRSIASADDYNAMLEKAGVVETKGKEAKAAASSP